MKIFRYISRKDSSAQRRDGTFVSYAISNRQRTIKCTVMSDKFTSGLQEDASRVLAIRNLNLAFGFIDKYSFIPRINAAGGKVPILVSNV